MIIDIMGINIRQMDTGKVMLQKKENRATQSDGDFIPYCQHSVSEEEIAEIVDTLRSDWLTKGPKTLRFEQAFAEYVGSRHAIAVNSCTAALHLALRGYDIREGDEVITTPMTFVATAEVCEYLGVKPVFADIDPVDFNIDPQQIESRITEKTRAILPVHYGGIPCDLERIYALAEAFGLQVIEDAAHAVGSEYRHRKIGGLGNPTAFSFYPTKNMTTGEGGVITTDDDALANKYRVLSLHGISKDAWKRYSSEGQWYYEIHDLGYKYNFTDIQAAMGLQQLRKLDEFNATRERYARIYFDALSEVSGIEMPRWYGQYFDHLKDEGFKSPWHLFVIMIDPEKLSIDRNQFIEELKARGIGTSVHFIPLHFQPYYAKKYDYQPGDYPNTEWVFQRIISIPLYPRLTETQVHYIIDVIADLAAKHLR